MEDALATIERIIAEHKRIRQRFQKLEEVQSRTDYSIY